MITRILTLAFASLSLAPVAHAQFELKSMPVNRLDPRQAGASATVSAGGVVTALTVRAAGAYTSAPLVTIAPPANGITATATAVLTAGKVTSFSISGGSGYSSASPPAVVIAPPYVPGGSPVLNVQFAGEAVTAATAGPLDSRPWPRTVGTVNTAGTIGGTLQSRYPNAAYTPPGAAAPTVTMVLKRASFGYAFASGVPLYQMGDEILPPTKDAVGADLAATGYWRSRPVAPGEEFSPANLADLGLSAQPVIAAGTVTVTQCATTSSTVTVAAVPAALSPGASLLGSTVYLINGTTLTLAGKADRNIAASTPGIVFQPYQPYYYSKHADKVFATQTGRVAITWVSNVPDQRAGESSATYKFRKEVFSVSSGTRVPVKEIFWTQKTFSGPLVEVPKGRVEVVNPVFNTFVPGKTAEYVPVGGNSGSETTEAGAEPRTLWFDPQPTAATPNYLRAYNAEGRVFIEYLGKESGQDGEHEFLGADIVEIHRSAPVETLTTLLGEKLRPRAGPPQDGDDQLTAPVGTTLGNLSFAYIRPDTITDYYAERENLNPDNIIIHWMAKQDAALYTAAGLGASGLDISWPQMKCNYYQKWPTALVNFEPVNVILNSAGTADGPRFAATSLPSIVFQDDPQALEAAIVGETQRLRVDFSASADKTNRSLLKFNSGGEPYYSRFYIQSEARLGSPETIVNDVTTPAVYTLNDLNADGVADWSPGAAAAGSSETPTGGTTLATVGSRIEPPRPDYALAGQIASGTCYARNAYIDPLAIDGFDAAAKGAIIPVNTLPNNTLKVFWYKKVTPANAKIEPFHVPAIAARYTVSYPVVTDSSDDPQLLVIASGKGMGMQAPLTSIQKSGFIYSQPDPAAIGYNPNEEHSVMVDGNVYALRDDLNLSTSSQPFVLLQYTDPAVGSIPARPAMRVAKVVRTNADYPLSYAKTAGTPVQPPMPLTLLPPPRKPDGTWKNTEVAGIADSPPSPVAADNLFTYEDRKGQKWLFRGPHNPAQSPAPSFGMQFYYYVLAGFDFPGHTTPPAVGDIEPYIAYTPGTTVAVTLTYQPKWPDDPSLASPSVLGVLKTAQTLTLAKDGLPDIMPQTSAQILYQQSIAKNGNNSPSVALHDPVRKKISLLENFNLAALPASISTTDYAGRTYFQGLPPNLQGRFYFDSGEGAKGGLVLEGEFVDAISGEDYLNLNQLSLADINDMKGLCPEIGTANKTSWDLAVAGLKTTLETFRESLAVPGTYVVAKSGKVKAGEEVADHVVTAMERADITDPDTAVVNYALSSTGQGTGYVTLLFNNGSAFTDSGDAVSMSIIKVSPELYTGDLKVNESSNPLDEQVSLRHSGDYGGRPENFEFRWRYGFSQSGLSPSGDPTSSAGWLDADPANEGLGSSILVGGGPTAVLSAPAVLMGDVWFTMSYRLKAQEGRPAGAWSDWTTAQLVEGWIKRVLGKITPFNQRMTDLYNNSVSTDVSLITQAGTRWEGDIALNLDNINDAGLIAIYETVLNRGKSFTIGSDIDTDSANNALILAAGYLNDLYNILGNEAYADAANPTISVDDQDSVTEVNTSRFAFEGQVASSLDEELALLRGRDDFGSPEVGLAPAYNRLWWNYTRGINGGEAIYAVNYNIREKGGSATANGIVDAADAQRMFPQGHGDAYGHYLTALQGYYKLLTHPYFTWVPTAESVTVLGQAVLVDYKDERKFAASAANVARTAQQMLSLEHRASYNDDPAAGWGHFRDGKLNPRTDVVRHQGMDETASRATQGAFFHWITGNALLPDKDTNPEHSGVQIVDRTTVPELNELISSAVSFQTTMDSANARLNPLGLAPGAIAFDLDPYFNNSLGQELADPTVVGKSHYEQISVRAVQALNNAAGSFNQAAIMTRSLRTQENQISNLQNAIEDEDYAMLQELFDIYGSPYPGDIGAGKPYPQGYGDPDYARWSIIDRPSDLVDTVKPVTVTLKVPVLVKVFTGDAIDDIITSYTSDTVTKTFQVTPNQWAQFADVVGPGTALGKRPYSGALQEALLEAHLAQVALISANTGVQQLNAKFTREAEVFKGLVNGHTGMLVTQGITGTGIVAANTAAAILESLAYALELTAESASGIATASWELLPKSVGLANDVTSAARGTIGLIGEGTEASFKASALVARGSAGLLVATVAGGLELIQQSTLMSLGFDQEELQAAYEFEQTYRETVSQHNQFVELLANHQTAMQKVRNLQTAGDTIRLRRETLRQRAAAVINGYRTKDLTFRTFRNEALEQYRTLFDLASRYSYLAAKAYDYETGLLGTAQGNSVFSRIVASRSLGDLTGGIPRSTTSTLGDAGLAGSMAQLNADFSVAEGRLGINNPDHYNTVFSLRSELFRIMPHAELLDVTSTTLTPEEKAANIIANDETRISNEAWQQTLELCIKPNVLSDPQVAAYCRNLKKADGSAVPGFIIEFGTSIEHGMNFFGRPLAAGDHAYSASTFATKIAAAGVVFPGYVGMAAGESVTPDALSATPYAYLIPCGTDHMLAPLGDTNTIRSWLVNDQALPLPYNLGANDFNSTRFFTANGTLSEQPWVIRKHQAFRAVSDPTLFDGDFPIIYSNARLIGRSAWNTKWKIVIPAYTLLNDEQKGLNNFAASVQDVQLFLRTYSHSGN